MTPAMTKLPRFVYGDQEHKRAVADETRNYKFNNRQFCGIKVLQIPWGELHTEYPGILVRTPVTHKIHNSSATPVTK